MSSSKREAIAEAIQRGRCWPAMKRALLAVLRGVTYREAAAAEGLGFREVHHRAQSIPGLCEAHDAAREALGGVLPMHSRKVLAKRRKARKAAARAAQKPQTAA